MLQITDSLERAHLKEMRNYIGIVTNEKYLTSNEIKEFNLKLSELLVLEIYHF